MAELSRFWTTNDIGDGPAAGYEQDLFADFLVGVFTDGVLRAVAGELAVTGAVSPVAIATGAAIVGGRYYQNTTLLQLGVATPSVGTTAFSVLLAADWTAQEVRAYVNRADDGNETYPSPTDNWGTKVEIKIAQGLIDVAGNISLTGGQTWAVYSTTIPDGSINTPQIADDAITTEKIKDLNVTTAKIKDLAITHPKIADGAITYEKLQDGAITNPKVAPGGLVVTSSDIRDGEVLRWHLGYGAPRIYAHQGNSANDWDFPGSNTYSNPILELQCGAIAFDFAGSLDIAFHVTYPRAYIHGAPIGFLSVMIDYPFGYDFQITFESTNKATADIRMVRDSKTGTFSGVMFWMVMGGAIQI